MTMPSTTGVPDSRHTLHIRAGNEPSRTITERFLKLPVPYDLCQHPNLNVKALIGAFNLEKALVRSDCETQTSQRLVSSSSAHVLRCQRKYLNQKKEKKSTDAESATKQ